MKVYGSEICINCRNFKHINTLRGLNIEFIDITENTANLKEFLKLRDNESIFEDVKKNGKIGIPAFLHNEKITLDINEALSWIDQPPVNDDEILEKA